MAITGPQAVVTTKYGGFGCYHSGLGTSLAILNDGAAATALPAYATGEALEVISAGASAANDDGSPVGTGARTVTVVYIDPTLGAVTTETVTMNGTTAVALTDTTVSRVLDMFVATAGSSGTNEGAITIRVAGAGANRMTIPAGHGRAAPGRFTIPTGYYGIYRGFALHSSTGTSFAKMTALVEADFNPYTNAFNEGVYQAIDWAAAGPATGRMGYELGDRQGGTRLYLKEKTTVRVRAAADAGTPIVAGRVFIQLYRAPVI